MAGSSGGRSLEETPTWAVAVVCFFLVLISIIIEHILHMIGNWLRKKHKRALYEALEKIKSELMLLGFISLLLTVGQSLISNICISEEIAATWHPCSKKEYEKLFNGSDYTDTENRRRLLAISDPGEVSRRSLAGGSVNKCAAQGKVPFVSPDGIHQLHMFIFVLALFHVLYCVLTLALGRAKIRRGSDSQGKHPLEEGILTFGPKPLFSSGLQFVRSVPKVDYLTLRHGFIVAHLAPSSQTKFDFQKYINRSLDEDFNVVVGISPPIWFLAVLFLLFNTHGGMASLYVAAIYPIDYHTAGGNKAAGDYNKDGAQNSRQGRRSGQRSAGGSTRNEGSINDPLSYIVLHSFQNAFQLAFFAWTWSQFGLRSCFHEHVEDVIVRISMGVVVQILCSYVTLPLYALVTQMGSNMKPTIFNERVATALKNWHNTAKKHIKHNKGSVTPFSSRPTTPSHHASPVHLLRSHRNEIDSLNTSPRRMNFEIESDIETPSRSQQNYVDGSSTSQCHINVVEQDQVEYVDKDVYEPSLNEQCEATHHKINSKEFSFDRRTN
ncbi:hypothetical protein V6N13_107652 [Hibiscus sabdariffa]|uniref:MLO-like protein n=1 Tax=Hibiscus sabdariffa TaxID=183260 RepID=A0ABR2SQM8_9ROSI